MKRVLVALADGCEELEAVTIIDLLRRAGLVVVTASLSDTLQVSASRGVSLLADKLLDDVSTDQIDMLVLPGGQPGTDTLNADPRIHALIQHLYEADRLIAAICAAPMVLAKAGLLDGRRATAYPGTLDNMASASTILSEDPVVVDGNVVTSRGPGTAMDFALTLIELLTNKSTRNQVESGLVRC